MNNKGTDKKLEKPRFSRQKYKSGPLKSTPGFLKCMRSVYLFFKEEKEKGALNIPINSFIERTAVACGVGRGTLYNYAKKGLFDEHPVLLQPKNKKNKKIVENNLEIESKRQSVDWNSMDQRHLLRETDRRSVEVQTDVDRLDNRQDHLPNNRTIRFESATTVNVVGSCKVQTSKNPLAQEVSGPWAGGNSARRDIDYFTKTNIWQNVYSIHPSDIAAGSPDLIPARMGNCQPTSSDLIDL